MTIPQVLRSVPPHDSNVRRLYPGNSFNPPRSVMAAVSAGLRGHCPACAKAPLPSRRDLESCRCAGCGEDFGASEVASAVPLFVAPVAAGTAALVAYALNLTTDLTAENQLVLLVPLACWIGISIFEPISGALVALQWALWIGHFDRMAPSRDAVTIAPDPVTGPSADALVEAASLPQPGRWPGRHRGRLLPSGNLPRRSRQQAASGRVVNSGENE